MKRICDTVFETLEELKETIDTRLGLTSTVERNAVMYVLVYSSPTGVPLIECGVQKYPEGWMTFGISSTTSKPFTLEEV